MSRSSHYIYFITILIGNMSNRKKEIEIRDGEEWMRCTKCLEFKPLSAYTIRKDRWQPYRHCTKCRNIVSLQWEKDNPEKCRIRQRNYKIKNRDIVNEKRKKNTRLYYERHKDAILEKCHKYTKTKRHYAIRKRLWRKWYDIGDPVSYNGIKFKIVAIRPSIGYCISRAWLPPITVPRKKLTPITYTIC